MFPQKLTSNYTLINVPLKEKQWFNYMANYMFPKKLTSNYTLINVPPQRKH